MDFIELFAERQIVFQGNDKVHAVIPKGTHTDFYFHSQKLCASSDFLSKLMKEEVLPRIKQAALPIDGVATYGPHSIPIAENVAQLLDVPFFYSPTATSDSLVHSPPKGAQVLIVVDDVVSGRSLSNLIEVLQGDSATVSSVFCIANLSSTRSISSVPIQALFEKEVKNWPAEECPLCAAGSQSLSVLEDWDKLFEMSNS